MATAVLSLGATAQDFDYDKKLQTISSSVVINASQEKVWDMVYGKYQDVADYHPMVDHSSCTSGHSTAQEGMQRQCNMDVKESKYTSETIISVSENDHYVLETSTVKGLPLSKVFAVWKVEDLGNGRSKATHTMHYRAKPSMMGGLMKGKLNGSLDEIVIGLKYHMETGGIVKSDNIKEIKKAYKSLASKEDPLSRVQDKG